MYDMMAEPPKPGTPLESLMLLVWRMRQDIEVQKTKAIVQAVIASAADAANLDEANKRLSESWDQYLDEVFPFKRGRRVKADQLAIEYLKQEAARGPLRVIPLQPLTKAKSRLRSRSRKVKDE